MKGPIRPIQFIANLVTLSTDRAVTAIVNCQLTSVRLSRIVRIDRVGICEIVRAFFLYM